MTEERKQEFIQAMISFIDNGNIGAEALEGYIDSEDIHTEWQQFQEEI